MDPVSMDTFLLLVLLILVGIVLFLSLVIALYVIRLSRDISGRGRLEVGVKRPVLPKTQKREEISGETASPVVPSPAEPLQESAFDVSRDAPDIPTGMKNLCRRYGLASLTVSSADGLVVASSGHPDAVADAAQYSYAFLTGVPLRESGVFVFPVDFRGTPLVGILRRTADLPGASLEALQKDIARLLERWI
ncbi:MAG: hypothetical protein A4E37_01424 [Methanoregulaceae archaeon PtaB.Bin056]|nr:MAG: hypothetical protein A4E37_01424 [Methanoregulaceae archaeon PtaB.Bin056]